MKLISFFICISIMFGCSSISHENRRLVQHISVNPNFQVVKQKARELIGSGFTAGDSYGEIWIRDFNTFINLSCDVVDHQIIREKLLTFFRFQGADGNIVDAYIPKNKTIPGTYEFIYSVLEPKLAAHKNTVETDQESSLIQAVAKYIRKTGDRQILELEIDGKKVSERMEIALDFLMTSRFSEQYGLIWGGTTADWGDVQPEHDWGVFLNHESHHSIDIYDNAMLVIAIKKFIEMVPEAVSKWSPTLEKLQLNIRKNLWDEKRMKFKPHIYLNGSPFPESLNEDEIFYHGGTAVAIEAGLLGKKEIQISLEKMIENVKLSGAASIGLTLYPAYPAGSFKNTLMVPYGYQNGGDWTWFGARMIQQLVINGFVQEAYEQILPMTDRVVRDNGFFEWYSLDNKPKGSGSYRGTAGVLYQAILMLENWASENK